MQGHKQDTSVRSMQASQARSGQQCCMAADGQGLHELYASALTQQVMQLRPAHLFLVCRVTLSWNFLLMSLRVG